MKDIEALSTFRALPAVKALCKAAKAATDSIKIRSRQPAGRAVEKKTAAVKEALVVLQRAVAALQLEALAAAALIASGACGVRRPRTRTRYSRG